LENTNLANFIYEKLLNDIVELRLAPGDFIIERYVSEMYEVSRTPVREAIKRLTQEGWLVAENRKRPRVKGFSLGEGRALFQFRNMVELFALNWAFENEVSRRLAGALDVHIKNMRKAEGNRVSFLRSDVSFHTEIISTVQNDFIYKAWYTIGNEMIRTALYGMDYQRTTDKILNEHEALIRCLWENERQEAADTLIQHHKLVFEGIERQLSKFE
jgi:DNA-binding GntR family transcriptional regulator